MTDDERWLWRLLVDAELAAIPPGLLERAARAAEPRPAPVLTRPTPAERLAAHFADPHGCCWVIPSVAGSVQCGLWCGHDGDHLDYVPGSYLPPMLQPLDVLRLHRSHWAWLRCPICRQPAHDWDRTAPDWTIWHVAGEERPEKCSWWRFGPCGCEARELR